MVKHSYVATLFTFIRLHLLSDCKLQEDESFDIHSFPRASRSSSSITLGYFWYLIKEKILNHYYLPELNNRNCCKAEEDLKSL